MYINLVAAVATQEVICHLAMFLLGQIAAVSFNCSAEKLSDRDPVLDSV